MILDKWFVAAVGLCAVTGCSSGSSDQSQSKSPVGPGNAKTLDYVDQAVQLDSDLVIPSGKTVHVGSGVTFTAAPGVKIAVTGTLIVDATAASPTRFVGEETDAAPSNYWHGIEIEPGGNVELTHTDIEGAEYGIHALAGSTYKVDYGVFGTSFKPAVLEADGTFDHSIFNAAPSASIAITLTVTIDDPNGTMTILNASPKVTNSFFDGASAFTDMVRVGGTSVPVFDHDHFKGAHCAFHIFGATNNSPVVTNSIIENMSYGAMAFTSKVDFENCNFLNNTDDVGYCYGAAAANAPTLTGDYFLAGDATVDASCFQIGTKATGTVSAPVAGAGPVGL